MASPISGSRPHNSVNHKTDAVSLKWLLKVDYPPHGTSICVVDAMREQTCPNPYVCLDRQHLRVCRYGAVYLPLELGSLDEAKVAVEQVNGLVD